MQTAPAVFYEDTAQHMTLATHKQAVERAIQVMHTLMHEVLTLEDLASVAYLSPSRFKHVFRHLIGIPPGEFLSALRLQAARHLLLTTPLSVTDICFEVGYSSMGSFTSRFTHLVGLSPRLLRQRAYAFEPPPAEPAERSPTTHSGLPRKHALLGNNASPLVFHQGRLSGNPDLVLHTPRVTDPPLVMGLPLL
jgi:AraC family transcriptional regulator